MEVIAYYLELMFIFLNIIQLLKLMKKDIVTKILFLKKKRQESLEKKLDCKFIIINTSKENYDADYENWQNTNIYQ